MAASRRRRARVGVAVDARLFFRATALDFDGDWDLAPRTAGVARPIDHRVRAAADLLLEVETGHAEQFQRGDDAHLQGRKDVGAQPCCQCSPR